MCVGSGAGQQRCGGRGTDGGLLLRGADAEQLSLDLGVQAWRGSLFDEWLSSADQERRAQTNVQHAIKPEEVSAELTAARESLGTRDQVRTCVENALHALHSTVKATDDGLVATLPRCRSDCRMRSPPGRNDPCCSPMTFPSAVVMPSCLALMHRWRPSPAMSSSRH